MAPLKSFYAELRARSLALRNAALRHLHDQEKQVARRKRRIAASDRALMHWQRKLAKRPAKR